MKKHKDTNKSFRLKIILAAIIVLNIQSIYAQEQVSTSSTLFGGFGYMAMSAEQLNIHALNTALSEHGYGQLNPTSRSIGGGGAFVVRNFVLGGNGAWLSGSDNKNADGAVYLKGGYGLFQAGYIIYSGKRNLLYPTLGIGGGVLIFPPAR